MHNKKKSEVKISVDGVDHGMYVVRLDRPWLGTPFTVQAFKVTKQKEIDQLHEHCRHVYIDTMAGGSPDPQFVVVEKPPKITGEIAQLHKQDYEIKTKFEDEIATATAVQEKLNHCVQHVLSEVQDDKKLSIEQLKDGVQAMIQSIVNNPSAFAWVSQLKETDDYTYRHSLGSSIWCASFGRFLGIEQADLERLAFGGLVIDIGKAKLPRALLLKETPLTDNEMKIVRSHVNHSVKILANTKAVDHDIMRMVASHHERHDGSGYPLGLKGEQIPIYGRIAGLVDSYDAMVNQRVFQKGRSPHDVISELYDLRGTKFQSELVEQFIQSCGVYPTGSLVELTTAEVGVVTELNSLRRLRPVVMLLLDQHKKPYEDFKTVDLSWGTNDEIDIAQGLPAGSFGINMDNLFL